MVKIHNLTKVKILEYLLNHKTEEFTIRNISKNVSIDYKTVYLFVKELIKEGSIKQRKAGHAILCSVNQEKLTNYLFLTENVRKDKILKNKNLRVMLDNIVEKAESPFFVLLLFGSYAARENTKKSDMDLLLIADDKEVKERIKDSLSFLPLDIHLVDFSSDEFLSMLKTTEFNVGKEVFKNNIILFGTESYYEMIKNA